LAESEFFTIDTYGDLIPASPSQPTTIRVCSGSTVDFTEAYPANPEAPASSQLNVGQSAQFTVAQRAISLCANVMVTRP
jgi:hypothetical protein